MEGKVSVPLEVNRNGVMAPQAKTLATKPGDLRLISTIHIVWQRMDSYKLSFHPHTHSTTEVGEPVVLAFERWMQEDSGRSSITSTF